MRIGYACHALGVPGAELRGCTAKNADRERLTALIAHNLGALERMVDYNLREGIRLYRISSDVIPFGSSPVNALEWDGMFAQRLAEIGRKIRAGALRVSMHPGQYTVLNAPDERTAENAARDIGYHARFLDALGVDAAHKIILHLGGAYGDKRAALERFCARYRALDEAARARVAIENDDRVFSAADALETGLRLGAPVVYDSLHNLCNPGAEFRPDADWIADCAQTWKASDGAQKVHYSQPDPRKRPGAHSRSVAIDEFLRFRAGLGESAPDVMLEVKDKNLSAVKCVLCADGAGEFSAPDVMPEGKDKNLSAAKRVLCAGGAGEFSALGREWGRYELLVLERSRAVWDEIRALFAGGSGCSAVAFYRLIERALALSVETGGGIEAAERVWDHLKDAASAREKAEFGACLSAYARGEKPLAAMRRKLYRLAEAHGGGLLDSYYFIPMFYESPEA